MPKTKRRVKIGYGGLSGPVHEHPKKPKQTRQQTLPSWIDLAAERQAVVAGDRAEDFGLKVGTATRLIFIQPIIIARAIVVMVFKLIYLFGRDALQVIQSIAVLVFLFSTLWIAYKLWEAWPQ